MKLLYHLIVVTSAALTLLLPLSAGAQGSGRETDVNLVSGRFTVISVSLKPAGGAVIIAQADGAAAAALIKKFRLTPVKGKQLTIRACFDVSAAASHSFQPDKTIMLSGEPGSISRSTDSGTSPVVTGAGFGVVGGDQASLDVRTISLANPRWN